MKSLLTIILLVIVGQSIAQITTAEYFIDTDPGTENGVTIPVGNNFTITESFSINTDGLEEGFHTMYVRVKDMEDAWSLYDKQSFHVSAPIDSYAISEAEYFIDTDPGIGNGDPIFITEDFTITENTNLSILGVEEGFHRLGLRVKDLNGNWSVYDQQMFYVTSPVISAEITEAEYFIDTDPGVGNANPVSVSEGFTVAEEFQILTNDLEDGFHTLYLRVKDDIEGWTLYDKQSFRVQTSGPIITAEFFIDSDPGIGNAEAINIEAGHNVYEALDVATNGLELGMHNLYIRVMDNDNVWSTADSAEFMVVMVSGLAEEEGSSFVIYPNPTTSRLDLRTEMRIQGLSVYDQQGRMVKNQVGEYYHMDVHDLAPGQYILEVLVSGDRQTFIFLKE